MSENRLKIGITQGDPNGIGWEVILKTFADPRMTELCTPVIYGSLKAAEFYQKTIADLEPVPFHIASSIHEIRRGKINLILCGDETKIEPGTASPEAGRAAAEALHAAVRDLRDGTARCTGHGSDRQGVDPVGRLPLYGTHRISGGRAGRRTPDDDVQRPAPHGIGHDPHPGHRDQPRPDHGRRSSHGLEHAAFVAQGGFRHRRTPYRGAGTQSSRGRRRSARFAKRNTSSDRPVDRGVTAKACSLSAPSLPTDSSPAADYAGLRRQYWPCITIRDSRRSRPSRPTG